MQGFVAKHCSAICSSSPSTNGTRFFAEGRIRSAKKPLPLAKALSRVALGKGRSAQYLTAKATLPRAASWALGKGFAEG